MTSDEIRKTQKIILWLSIIGYVALFGWLAFRQHAAFETGALDLGNYDQAMWNAAHGRGLELTTLPQYSLNRMGLHVEPILFLLVPLYWLWSSPLVLLAVQTLALALAAHPLFLLAHRRLQNRWAALAIALAYLLLPATQAVNLFDFHAVSLSPLFMLWGLYFLDFFPDPKTQSTKYEIRKITIGIIFLLLAMSTKEDISLHVFMVGLYFALIRRQWKLGGGIVTLGLAWAFVAFGVVIPAFRVGGGQSAYVGFFPALGNSPLEIALSPITHPRLVLEILFRPENLQALGMLTLPFALLNLIGMPVFLLTAPSLAITLLSNNPLQQQLETWHYAAPMLPFIALAAADGMARITHHVSRITKNSIYIIALVLLLFSLGYHYLRGYSPLSKPFHLPIVTEHQRLGDEIAASIPASAAVVAQAELVPHLSQRRQVEIWQGDFPADADYIFVDMAHQKFVNRENAQVNFLSDLIYNKAWGFADARDGYLLLKKNETRLIPDDFYSFALADARRNTAPELARFGDTLALVGAETQLNRTAEPQMTLYFRILKQPAEDYFPRLYLLDAAGNAIGATIVQQPVPVWVPAHVWEKDSIIKIRFNTLPWWTGDGKHAQFSYALGVSRVGDDPTADAWNLSLRLPAQGENLLPDNLIFLQSFYRLAGMVYAK